MATLIRMPAVMTGAAEAVIATWVAREGETVAVGDVLAEVETDKAVVELASESAGVLIRRLAADGETVQVGAPVAVLGEAGEDVDLDALLGAAAAMASEAQASADDDTAVGAAAERAGAAQDAVAGRGSGSPTAAGATADAATEGGRAAGPEGRDDAATQAEEARGPDDVVGGAAGSPGAGGGTAPGPGQRLFASPLARKMAREAGLDIARLAGSGPGGRIVRRDVEAAVAAGGTVAAAAAPSAGPEPAARPASLPGAPGTAPAATGTHVPHTSMRRAIARRLSESKATVPHFYVVAEPRADALLELRRRVNESGDVRVSVNDLVVKAVSVAYRAVPEANVQWGEDAMTHLDGVDVAIAVATDGGLLTPVLRGVDRLPVSEIARLSADLVGRARAGRLRQAELEGGSITVSNLGMYGTPEFSAILNPPQSAILAVGAAVERPVVVDGELAVGTVVRCVLSADHRAVDGAVAARWAAAFTTAVENPLTILI